MSTLIICGAVGILCIVLGILLLRFKSSITMLTFYKPGKYDDDKLRKLAGWHVIAIGIINFLFGICYEVLPIDSLLSAVSITHAVAITAIVVKVIHRANKDCRK